MPKYVGKYAICALCQNMQKMRQSAKYAAIAYSRFSDIPKKILNNFYYINERSEQS